MEIPTITINPAPTHTVIFLHGRGDNAQNFRASLSHWRDSQGRTLADAFPTFRWVMPEAPLRQLARNPSMTMRQWFDVWNVDDFTENEDLQAVGLKEMVPGIRKILATEAAHLGGRYDRLILMGISMGAATSTHTLLNLDVPLAAFIGVSSRCPFAGRDLAQMRAVLSLDKVPTDNEVLKKTPVLLEHCIDDPLVRIHDGRRLRDTLLGFGSQVEWKEYPNGGHWFNSPAGMDDAVKFIEKHVLKK